MIPDVPSREELERRRREVKAARVWARDAHPFDRSQRQDDAIDVYDDGREADAVLVAFPGTADRLGMPSVDFFEMFDDWQLRRIYVRKLGPSVERYPHSLGATVPDIAAALRERTRPHQRKVFIGTSLGGFYALLFGTLVGADVVLAMGAITSMHRTVLDEAGDHRWDEGLASTSDEWLSTYGDIPTLWQHYPAPRTIAHYSYVRKEYCVQAEHIAGFPNVEAISHDEHFPFTRMVNNGEMRSLLASVLWPDGEPPLRAS